MTLRLETPLKVDRLAAVYGKDDMQLLVENIEQSLEEAHDRLPMREPVAHVEISVSNSYPWNDYIFGGVANYKARSVTFYVNPSRQVLNIVAEIPRVTRHEVAHLAHYQQNPASVKVQAKQRLWTIFTREGMAEYAAHSLQVGYDPAVMFDFPHNETNKMMQVVWWAATHIGAVPEDLKYDMLGGDGDVRPSGYQAAHYMVASMAAIHGYSVRETMKLNQDDYRYFIGAD